MEMNPNPEARGLRDLQGAAELLGCGKRKVRGMVADGILPAVRLPGSRVLRFRVETIEKLIESSEVVGTVETGGVL